MEKEKRGGESRRILSSSADMSAPLVRFNSVSRQESAAGSGGNAKHPGNRPRTAELLLPKWQPNTNKVHNEKGEIQREKRLAAGRRPTGLCHACRITGAAQAAPPAHRHITHD
mgnify:CR=1 FL=1